MAPRPAWDDRRAWQRLAAGVVLLARAVYGFWPFDGPQPAPTPAPAPGLAELEGGRVPGDAGMQIVRDTDKALSDCDGREEQWAFCRERACSQVCEPQHCLLAHWSDWAGFGGCSGLGMRHRAISQVNNECGKPCHAFLSETAVKQEFLDDHCKVVDQDCFFSPWSDWSHCGDCKVCHRDALAQSIRTRDVQKEASGSGSPCTGDWNQTKACAWQEDPIDCNLTGWGEWTTCSATCGGGTKVRLRRVVPPGAQFGGKPCNGALRAMESCNTQACRESVDCKLGPWSDWRGCWSRDSQQQYRQRGIVQEQRAGGKPCEKALQETMGCPQPQKEEVLPCRYSQWTPWSHCSEDCNGGQQSRTRMIDGSSRCKVLEHLSLKEIRGCNTKVCSGMRQCRLSEWSDWSACSSECGQGVTVRDRRVLELAKHTEGCQESLSEAKECNEKPCEVVDCKWGSWDVWGACTTTCGGGIKRRSRVVAISPRGGGQLCSAEDKSQVQACHTQSCERCVDGRWTQWGEWSSCTATCGRGYRWRTRGIGRRHNYCGKPVAGLEEQYELCTHSQECEFASQDCILSEWGSWGACSCSCHGVKERHRRITQFARFEGRPCVGQALEEMAPCNPGLGQAVPRGCSPEGPQDCILGAWQAWAPCSLTCGGGERTRVRPIQTPASHGGKPCEGGLQEMAPCATTPCSPIACVDCKWGAWSKWGACSKCGGQRYRQRMVERLPNHCGQRCDARLAKETGQCKSECGDEKALCRWTDWYEVSDCSATCGTATKMERRQLLLKPVGEEEWNQTEVGDDIFLKGTVDMVCSGEQTRATACTLGICKADCTPVDCTLSSWGEWGPPSCALKLCTRTRRVVRRNRCGGLACNGSTDETKSCGAGCEVKAADCRMAEWSSWSGCEDKSSLQMKRERRILKLGKNGGKPCSGNLVMTKPCEVPEDSKPRDCILLSWDDWSECTHLCGGGFHKRVRSAIPANSALGKPCEGSVFDLAACNTHPCLVEEERSCRLSQWTSWSDCTPQSSQKHRHRHVSRSPSGGGTPCKGSLREVQQCDTSIDCKVTAWTAWDECDKTCDGGQRQRHRQVIRNPRGEGMPCPLKLIETQGCNWNPCVSDLACQETPWSDWGACSVTCGEGEQVRTRSIAQNRKSHCGVGCIGSLKEARKCSNTGCDCQPCKWSEWSPWTECSRHCGGGQHFRHRNVTKLPGVGCTPCDAKETVIAKGCNLEACPEQDICVDAKWNDWQEWEVCSTTCQGGTHGRERSVRQEANHCGKPLVGFAREARECLVGVPCLPEQDCQWGQWSAWTDCSNSCEGVKTRTRKIQLHGYGPGKYCEGATNETQSCAFGHLNSMDDFSKSRLYMKLYQVEGNNLGGAGPDVGKPEHIRFKGAASDGVRTLDLIVRSTGSYHPADSHLNGIYHDGVDAPRGIYHDGVDEADLANINVGSGQAAELELELLDSETGTAVVAEDLVLKFFDLDMGDEAMTDKAEHSITVNTPCEEYFTTDPSHIKVEGACLSHDPITFRRPEIVDPVCRNGLPKELNLANVIHSNLANKGPNTGSPTMRYSEVGFVGDQAVDLVIQVMPGSIYEPSNAMANGHYQHFGLISQVPGDKASFIARFVKKGLDVPIRVQKVNITFVDLDKPTFRILDRLVVRDFKEFFFPNNGKTRLIYRNLGAQGASFTASEISVPEPSSLWRMTTEQKDAAVTFFFEDIFQFTFDLEVVVIGEVDDAMHRVGQAFMFAGFICNAPVDPRTLLPVQPALALPSAPVPAPVPRPVDAFPGRPPEFQKRFLTRRLSAAEAMSCPQGFYRDAPIIFHCHGSQGKVSFTLPEHTLVSIEDLPFGVKDLRLTIKSEQGVDIYIWDLAQGHYMVHPTLGAISDQNREGTYGKDLWVEYSGSDAAPPTLEDCRMAGTLNVSVELRMDNHAEVPAKATIEYSYSGLAKCPANPVGCVPYDEAHAQNAVLSWAQKMRRDFGNNDQAWGTFNEISQPEGIPWEEWIEVWDRVPTWKLAFRYLDSDGDGYISRAEFDAGYALTKDSAKPLPTPAPSWPPAPPSSPPVRASAPTAAPTGAPASQELPEGGQLLEGPPQSEECQTHGVTRPMQPSVSPVSLTFQQEQRAVAVRFKYTSKVNVRLKVNGGCGHNFLFAAKACIWGNCDPCPAQRSCKFMDWSSWDKCSVKCGGGIQQRTREFFRVPTASHAGGGGEGCQGPIVEAHSCNTLLCNQTCQPVDCKLSQWSEWGACDKCGGQKERARFVNQTAKCGGMPCEAIDTKQIAKCPRRCHGGRFCIWEDWSKFGNCSVTCGCGRKKRTRSLKVSDTPPNHEDVEQLLQTWELRGKVQEIQRRRVQAMVLSFGAGCCSLVFSLVLFRAFERARHRRAQRGERGGSVLLQRDLRLEGLGT